MLRELFLWLAVIMLTIPAALSAQSTVARVRGTVKNMAGARLQGATVTLTKVLTEPPRCAVTDRDGMYSISSVPPGIYTVQVTCRGYEDLFKQNFAVRGSHSEILDFAMRPKAIHGSQALRDSTLGSAEFYEGTEFKAAPLTDPTSGGGHSNQAAPVYREYPPSTRASEARVRSNPQDVFTEAELEKSGITLLARRDFTGAIRLFEAAVLRYPRAAALHLQLGRALCEAGRYDSGLRQFSEAARLEPDNPRAYVLLAEAEDLTLRRETEITTLLRSFRARHPERAESHYAFGLGSWVSSVRERNAQGLSQAQSEFEKAVEINPAFARARLRLGMVYDELHWPERAADQYRQAIRLSPNLAAAHYRLAQDELRAGATEDAREQLDVYRNLVQSHTDRSVLEDTLEK